MLEITILGSGSAGNSALVSSGQTRLLLDAGLSCKQLRDRMAAMGTEAESLDGILLTHEHGDHTRGLDVFCRRVDVPIFCNPLTRESLSSSLKEEKTWKLVQTGAEFNVGDIVVETFTVPHDAVDPIGFVVRDDTSSIGFVSDFGFVTSLVKSHLGGVDTLVMEANYDDVMLQNDTKRPWSTKQRITSRHGHLSNDQAAECARDLYHHGLERVILGHLSRDCNEEHLAKDAVRSALSSVGGDHVDVCCARQDTPTPWFAAAAREKPVVAERTVVREEPALAAVGAGSAGMVQMELL